MKRKRLFRELILMTSLLALGLTACGKEMAVKEIDTLAQAKSDLYESAAELESAATLVVRVERTETAENVIKSLGIPDAWYGYTLSMVKVNEKYFRSRYCRGR